MLKSRGNFYVMAPHLHNIRQHIPGHIGLPTYASIHELGSKVELKVEPFFEHTRSTTSMTPYLRIENAIAKISTSETKYQMLKKVGMANVEARLFKQQTSIITKN